MVELEVISLEHPIQHFTDMLVEERQLSRHL